MISCPNKNTNEWKNLLEEVGEDRAYIEWNKRNNWNFQKLKPIPKSKVKDHLNRSFKTEISDERLRVLKKDIGRKNNRNKEQGINEVYHLENIKKIGEADLYTWDLIKTKGSLDVDAKIGRAKSKVVDPSQSTYKISEAERLKRKTDPGEQLSMFQKIEAGVYDFLESKYQNEYGVSFTDSVSSDRFTSSEKKQADLLFKNFGIPVEFDSNLTDNQGNPVSGAVKNKKVYINPNYKQEDTLIHEYAHILIDSLGIDNPRIKAAIEKLEDTQIWNDTLELYPELDPITFRKEVLATALGKKGHEVFEREFNQNWWQRFLDWFLTAIGTKVNKSKDEIESLVNEMFKKKRSVSDLMLSKISQFQKFTNFDKKENLSVGNILKEASESLQIKINRWKTKAEKEEKADKYLKHLTSFKAQVDKYLETENVVGFINIANYVENQLEDIKDKINSNDVSSVLLNTIDSFKGSFDFINQINNLIRNQPEVLNTLSEEQKSDLKNKINNILASSENIDGDVNELSKRLLASKFAELDAGYVYKMYELQAENEFIEQNRKFDTKKEKAEAKEKYIDEYVENHKDEIKEKSYNYFYNTLEKGKDISFISAKLLDSGQMNSQIIQLVQKMNDRQDMETQMTNMVTRAEMVEEYEKYAEENYNSNQEKMYKNIQEIGEDYNYLATMYDPKIIEQYDKLIHQKHFVENKEQEKEIEQKIQNWRAKYTTNGKLNKEARSEKYRNLNKSEKESLDFLKNQLQKDDKSTFGKDKLIFERFGETFYKLPSVSKSKAQLVRESGIKEASKKTVDEIINMQADDEGYGLLDEDERFNKKVFSDEKDEQQNKIPVYYRNKLKASDRSADVFSVVLANHYTTENFRNKNKIQADLQILSDVLENKKYIAFENGKSLVSRLLKGRFIKDTKKQSNEQEALRSIMENRLYGIGEIQHNIAGVSANKVASFLNSWSSTVMLGFNYFAFMPNLLMGHTMTASEAIAGTDINLENYKNANVKYWKNFKGVLDDVSKTNPNNKVSLLIDHFEILSFGNNEKTKFLDHKKLRSLMTKDNTFFFSKMAEHNIQSVLMLSVLDNVKIDGKKLYDLIEAKNGKLDFSKIDSQTLEKTKFKIKKLIADNNGQYDTRMKSDAQRTWYGGMAYMFRKWIPRGATKRFQGVQNVNKKFGDFENIEEDATFFSQESGRLEEGYYVSFMRMLLKAFKEYKGNVFKQYGKMTDYEKSNVKRTTFEFAVTLSMLGMYSIFSAMAKESDDGDDDLLYLQAYWFRRTVGELSFWYNIGDTLHMLRSPAASISFVEKLFKFTMEANPLTGWEAYQKDTGMFEKGDLKIQKRLKDITPIGNQLFRYEAAEDALNYIDMY